MLSTLLIISYIIYNLSKVFSLSLIAVLRSDAIFKNNHYANFNIQNMHCQICQESYNHFIKMMSVISYGTVLQCISVE